MPNIGEQDFGPTQDENATQEALRSDLGKYTNQEWLAANQPPISVEVMDYIGQFAAHWAIWKYALYFNNTERQQSAEWAKSWVSGFIAWYLDPQNAARRNDVASQPNFLETCYEGCLIRAKRMYRHIPWTLGYVKRADGLWLSGVSDKVLDRINMNLMGCTVDSWKSTKLRGQMGYLFLPSTCTHSGLTLELGDEIMSDWIDPPDNKHGHPFSTMCNLFKDRKAGTAKNSQVVGRMSYDVIKAGVWRIVVAEDKAPPCIITFFKVN